MDTVERLPYEDIRDHVLPVLAQRLPTLGNVAIVNACYLLGHVAPTSEVLAKNLMRVASEAGQGFANDILEIVSDVQVPGELRMHVVRTLLAVGVEPSTVGEGLASGDWSALCSIVVELDTSALNPLVLQSFASQVALTASYKGRTAGDLPIMPHPDAPLAVLLRCGKALAMLLMTRTYRSNRASAAHIEDIRSHASSDLPDTVRSGVFSSNFSELGNACWLPWLTHLTLGDVTIESWGRFLEWLAGHGFDHRTSSVWGYLTHNISPLASLIDKDSDYSDLAGLAETATALGGAEGAQEWLRRLGHVQAELRWLGAFQIRKLITYGPGVLA